MADQGDPEEPRAKRRSRVLKRGVVGFNGRHSTLECTVRNISESGCAITSDVAKQIPDSFELLIELDALWYPCEVVWRRPPQIGVHFTGPAQPAKQTRVQVVTGMTQAPRASLRRKPIAP